MAATLGAEAARWFARMTHAAPDDPQRGRFEAWLAASPAHAAEYARYAELWADFDSTARLERLVSAVDHRAGLDRRKADRRRRVTGGALGLAALGFGGLLGWQLWDARRHEPLLALARRSAPGQSLAQALPDGSRLTLAPGSEARVAYFRDRRHVRLLGGEALFEVAADAARPFVVEGGTARVTVRGTRFVVARLPGQAVRVSVLRGQVAVEAVAGGERRLDAGEVAEVRPGGAPRSVPRAAAEAAAWQRGALVFERDTLEEIAERLGRASGRTLDAAALREHPVRITAVVQLRDTAAFVRSLPAIAPVRLREAGDGWVLEPR